MNVNFLARMELLPIFTGMPVNFPKFLNMFEARLIILTATKWYEFNCIENPTARQNAEFDKYLEAFKVENLKSSLGDHLEDVVSSISEKQMEKFDDFKQALKDYFLQKKNEIQKKKKVICSYF